MKTSYSTVPCVGRVSRHAGRAGVALAILAAPLAISRSGEYDLSVVACYALPVIGLNVITGMAGQVSFATTAFMAIGGYASAILTVREGWNPWLALVTGGGIAALVAIVLGLPILRLRGHYLAMGTFALALAAGEFATAAIGITGGPVGIAGIRALSLGPLQFNGGFSFYVLVWITVIGVTVGVLSLQHSRVGRAWGALAEREDVARSLGVDIRRLKVVAFAISAVLGAIGGSFYVELTQFVSPDLYSTTVAVQVFAMLFVGGVSSVYGPILGAAIISLLPVIFSSLQNSSDLWIEIVVLAVLIIMPQGITSVIPSIVDRGTRLAGGRVVTANRRK